MKKKLSDLIKKENVVFLETIDMVDTIEVLTENAINNQKIKDKESFKNVWQNKLEWTKVFFAPFCLSVLIFAAGLLALFLLVTFVNDFAFDWRVLVF